MSDERQVNEADLDWLAERDQPLTDELRKHQSSVPAPAAAIRKVMNGDWVFNAAKEISGQDLGIGVICNIIQKHYDVDHVAAHPISLDDVKYVPGVECPVTTQAMTGDGWLLCPKCGLNELYSLDIPPTRETIVGCYNCDWKPAKRPVTPQAEPPRQFCQRHLGCELPDNHDGECPQSGEKALEWYRNHQDDAQNAPQPQAEPGAESFATDNLRANQYEIAHKPADLLPCPFCGCRVILLQNLTQQDDFYASCSQCEVQQIANHTEGDAVAGWNKRVAQAEPGASEPLDHKYSGYKLPGGGRNHSDSCWCTDRPHSHIPADVPQASAGLSNGEIVRTIAIKYAHLGFGGLPIEEFERLAQKFPQSIYALAIANHVAAIAEVRQRDGERHKAVIREYEALQQRTEARADSLAATLEKVNHALAQYGMHAYHECLYRWNVVDRIWEHRGAITTCRCGLADTLASLSPAPGTEDKAG